MPSRRAGRSSRILGNPLYQLEPELHSWVHLSARPKLSMEQATEHQERRVVGKRGPVLGLGSACCRRAWCETISGRRLSLQISSGNTGMQ